MATSTSSSQTSVEKVVEGILSSRRITRQDQDLLLSCTASTYISDREKLLVSKVYELLNKGFITVTI
ncbi:MAG: hypothetical protein SW833_00185 [Cyanobacteriota bacterium]|nr:hypothetical protein [Cyanobacteriota bacterium]